MTTATATATTAAAAAKLPAAPVRLLLELTLFMLLLVPGILWSAVRMLLPAKKKSVNGEVIVITGAARGIGRELALRFGKLGAKVACLDVIEAENNETADLIKKQGGTAASYKCDVSNKEQIKSVHEQVRKDLGPVDILINNAGIVWGHIYVDPSKDQFIMDQINVNLMGQYWMNREILPSMMERNYGHVVAMSSMSSMSGVAGISTYAVTKWATNGMMECLRNEMRRFNSKVKTTTILPYFVETNAKVTAELDIRIPELPVDVAGEVMVNGILAEKRVFSVPENMMYLTSLIRLLPDFLQDLFNKIIYVRIRENTADEALIAKYKR